jgi:ABC-type polysaccharide/polyol phosphate export permease
LAIFPLRVVLGAGFHCLISFSVAVGLAWVFKGPSDWMVMASLIPTLVLIFFLGWFLAILGGLFYVHFHDTQHILEIGLQIWFYLTPIMYPPESIRQRARFAWLLNLNPITPVLEAIRQPVLFGQYPPLHVYFYFAAFVGLVGLLAIGCLKKMERSLVFWI